MQFPPNIFADGGAGGLKVSHYTTSRPPHPASRKPPPNLPEGRGRVSEVAKGGSSTILLDEVKALLKREHPALIQAVGICHSALRCGIQ